MALITFEDKVSLNPQPSVADKNKVKDSDMNMIKNAVNSSTTYSTTEQVVGTWIDGKPIYRKVFTISSPQSTNTNYEDLSSLNIDSAFVYGYYKRAGGDKFDIPFYDSADNYSVMFINGSNQLRGRFGTPTTITEVKVVVEYTKTTD